MIMDIYCRTADYPLDLSLLISRYDLFLYIELNSIYDIIIINNLMPQSSKYVIFSVVFPIFEDFVGFPLKMQLVYSMVSRFSY